MGCITYCHDCRLRFVYFVGCWCLVRPWRCRCCCAGSFPPSVSHPPSHSSTCQKVGKNSKEHYDFYDARTQERWQGSKIETIYTSLFSLFNTQRNFVHIFILNWTMVKNSIMVDKSNNVIKNGLTFTPKEKRATSRQQLTQNSTQHKSAMMCQRKLEMTMAQIKTVTTPPTPSITIAFQNRQSPLSTSQFK